MFPWSAFLTYAFVTAFTPGPNTLMALSNGGRVGFKRSLPYCFGVCFGLSIITFITVLLMSSLSDIMEKIQLPIKIFGAAYMLYLAWGIYRSSELEAKEVEEITFIQATILQFVNPKLYLYVLVSVQIYVLPYFIGQKSLILFMAFLLSLIGFLAVLSWSAFGSLFEKLFSDYRKITNTVLALLLIYSAVSLFF